MSGSKSTRDEIEAEALRATEKHIKTIIGSRGFMTDNEIVCAQAAIRAALNGAVKRLPEIADKRFVELYKEVEREKRESGPGWIGAIAYRRLCVAMLSEGEVTHGKV